VQAARAAAAGTWTMTDRWLGHAVGVVKMAPYNAFLRLPCKKGAAARHLIYAGQRRRLDRIGLGL